MDKTMWIPTDEDYQRVRAHWDETIKISQEYYEERKPVSKIAKDYKVTRQGIELRLRVLRGLILALSVEKGVR